jgi:hypothetical protein
VLDGVGDENRLAVYSGVFKGFRENAAGWPDKWLPLLVFLVSRLFAHHKDACARRTLTRHNLGRPFVEGATSTFCFGLTQGGQRSDRRRSAHESLRKGNGFGTSAFQAGAAGTWPIAPS